MSNPIRVALESRLATWAAAQSTPVPVCYENQSFVKPTDDSPWLECFLKPNTTMNDYVGGTHSTRYGLFMVNVWTKDGIGMGQAEGIAEAIVALFPIIPKFGPVSVEQTPTINASISDEAGWRISPVLIKYRYEVYG